jgi:hypothetical protein
MEEEDLDIGNKEGNELVPSGPASSSFRNGFIGYVSGLVP